MILTRFMSAGDCLTMSTAHVKDDGGLLAVGRAGIDLGLPLVVVDEHVERDGRAQLGLSVLLGDFNEHAI